MTLTFIGNSRHLRDAAGDTDRASSRRARSRWPGDGLRPRASTGVDVPFGTLQVNGITSSAITVAGVTVAGASTRPVGYQRFKLTGAGLLRARADRHTTSPAAGPTRRRRRWWPRRRSGRRRPAPSSTSSTSAPNGMALNPASLTAAMLSLSGAGVAGTRDAQGNVVVAPRPCPATRRSCATADRPLLPHRHLRAGRRGRLVHRGLFKDRRQQGQADARRSS